MDINYRLACMDDINEIVELVKNAISKMERNHIFQWDELYPTKEDFIQDIANDSLYIGFYQDEMAVIFVLNQQSEDEYKNGKWLYPNKEYYIIHRFCVNCCFQNKGIGKHTMQFIEEKLRKKNIQAIRLDVFSKNCYALSLYEHMGYSRVGYADWRKGRFYLMEKYL